MVKEMIGGCCVCSDERGWDENPLVYCDGHGCNVAVHQGTSFGRLSVILLLHSGCVLMFVSLDRQLATESCRCRRDRGFVGNASRKRESHEW